MQKKIYRTQKLEDLPKVAQQFLDDWKEQKHFAFFGEMGVGKTTFIKEICDALGVNDVVTSPTFSIVNEYLTEVGDSVFHFDFYRIKDDEEVFDMGLDEYLDSGSVCLMEWAERIEHLLPEDLCRVCITEQDNGVRLLEVNCV